MVPKTLLTVIGSEQPLADLEQAISLCDRHACHLSVAVVGIALPPPVAIYTVIPTDAWAEEREEGQELVAEQARRIKNVLAKSEISADVTSYFCGEGQIAGIIGARARYVDLVLAQMTNGMDDQLHDKSLQGFLFESAKPFLVVPDNAPFSLKPRRVLVAWDASVEAARAVHLALDMLATAESVHVAMVDPVAGEYDHGDEPGNDIASYLARHGATVTVNVLSGGGRDPGEILLRNAIDVDADLIVAGAYGHSRLREYLFGGTTRLLLENDRFPVLMAH